jgi:hypothetical protein
MEFDLFEAALLNRPSLEERLAGLLSSITATDSARLRKFAEVTAEAGRVSINMPQGTLINFLVSGRHQNLYEWAAERAKCSSKPPDEITREKLGAYYERRMAFDGFFRHGTSFRYGTLNIGGLGCRVPYGEFCLVFKDCLSKNREESAYLRSDTLNTYLLPGCVIDEAAIRTDAAPHSHRHLLAAIKCGLDASKRSEDEWPALLCSERDFIEAIFTGEAAVGDLEAVRMAKADHELYFDYAFEDFRAKLSASDRLLIETFVAILILLERHGVPLELVDYA